MKVDANIIEKDDLSVGANGNALELVVDPTDHIEIGPNGIKLTDSFYIAAVGGSGESITASSVTVTPSGNLASNNVQGALLELQSDIDANALTVPAHVHGGSAISLSVTNFNGNLSAADNTVQKALDTLDNMSVAGSATNLGYSNGTITSSTGSNATIPLATTGARGLMNSTDKSTLDSLSAISNQSRYITSEGSNSNGSYIIWNDNLKEQWIVVPEGIYTDPGQYTVPLPINLTTSMEIAITCPIRSAAISNNLSTYWNPTTSTLSQVGIIIDEGSDGTPGSGFSVYVRGV